MQIAVLSRRATIGLVHGADVPCAGVCDPRWRWCWCLQDARSCWAKVRQDPGRCPAIPSAELWYYVSLRAAAAHMPVRPALFRPARARWMTLIATLNQNSEVVSMKAAGLSAHQVLAPLIVDQPVRSRCVSLSRFNEQDRLPRECDARIKCLAEGGVCQGACPRTATRSSMSGCGNGDDLIHARIVSGRARRGDAAGGRDRSMTAKMAVCWMERHPRRQSGRFGPDGAWTAGRTPASFEVVDRQIPETPGQYSWSVTSIRA